MCLITFAGKWIEIGWYVFQSGEITRAWNDWWSYSRHVHHIYGDPWSIHHGWGYQSFVRRQGNALFWFRWVRNVWFRFHGKNYYVHHLFLFCRTKHPTRIYVLFKVQFHEIFVVLKFLLKKSGQYIGSSNSPINYFAAALYRFGRTQHPTRERSWFARL